MDKGEHALIVFLGDSITEQNYHLHGHLNYVGLLNDPMWKKYGGHFLLVNAGVSGNTTSDLLARLERDALRFSPDLVSIMVGINDSCNERIPVKEYIHNLERLIAAIQVQGSEVILLTQHPLLAHSPEVSSQFEAYPNYIEAKKGVSRRMNISLIDIYDHWSQLLKDQPNLHWSLMDDPLHPNERGHRLIANLLIEKFKL